MVMLKPRRRRSVGLTNVTPVSDQVRARIKEWLAISGQNQTELGKAIGRRQNWVSRYLAGGIEIDFDTAAQIAAFFDRPLSALFDSPPDPTEAKLLAYYRGYPPALRTAFMSMLEQYHRRLRKATR